MKQLIKDERLTTQEELKDGLKRLGVEVTQSSLSRDLNELGIAKKQGFYQLPPEPRRTGVLPPLNAIKWAGPNLLVLKTNPSMAPSMGAFIDEQNISGIVGTVAGDDTLFVATAPAINKDDLEKRLREIFS